MQRFLKRRHGRRIYGTGIQITPWEAVKDGNSEDIEEARRLILEQYGEPPKVLDPFAGGGSIPLEALRLGCETYASDYDPVAVFIEKATLEWPQKFGIMVDKALLEEVEREGEADGGEAGRKDVVSGGDGSSRSASPLQIQGRLLDDIEGDKVNLLAYLVEKWANIVLEEARVLEEQLE